ncbi:MAG: SDR family oxidoreductase [Burkholderiales bacterium]|nr:SDR family oxidoreductase [Burkholderiales bacterium]
MNASAPPAGAARAGAHAPLAFITGASSGIGQALAARYAALGWRLALVARREGVLQEWARAAGLDGERCATYAADVAEVPSIVAAGAACMARQGLPDVVIANAGISVGMDTAEREDLDVMRDMLALNVLGVAATFHPFVAAMRERGGGRLVGVASMAALRGLPGHGAYCASKAGVVAYCESLRVECRFSGVRVVTLLPGYVATPLTAHNPYSMPFLIDAGTFAQHAVRAIEAGTSLRIIPWQMAIVAPLMRNLPNALYDRLFKGRKRKPRRGAAA